MLTIFRMKEKGFIMKYEVRIEKKFTRAFEFEYSNIPWNISFIDYNRDQFVTNRNYSNVYIFNKSIMR